MDYRKPFHREEWKPLVYICSPFSGDVKANAQKARRYSRFAVDSGAIPLAPHLLLPQYMDEETERDAAMFMDKVLLGKCEQMWVFGSRITSGMAAEIRRANKRHIRIRRFTEDCEEVKCVYEPKAIQTSYKGYLFRSRLEARWAVFFDTCGVDWEYEPEGYDLGDGVRYLPDFLLHGVDGRDGGDIYVEVKGQMTDADARKINRFIGAGNTDELGKYDRAVLIVGRIPDGDDIEDIIQSIGETAYTDHGDWPNEFNFESIDGDYFAAYPGINLNGKFELFGDDSSYLRDMDGDATERAYRKARCARFEYGETPREERA